MLHRYYLNGVDAFRLKLLLPLTQQRQDEIAAEELKQLSLSNGATGSSESSADAASDINNKQAQPQHQQHQKKQQPIAGLGQGSQGPQSEQANDLLQRLDVLRT